MTREQAEAEVSGRWKRLGLDEKAAPIMFGLDVDNLMEQHDGGTIQRIEETVIEMERRTR